MVFPVVVYGCESWTIKKSECRRIHTWIVMLEKTLASPLESLGQQAWTARRSNESILKKINPEYSLEGLMLKLKLNTLATWCKQLTHWRRSWRWERLKAQGEVGSRGWDGWMASLIQWTWTWANCGRRWGTGGPGATAHGVVKSRTGLGDWTHTHIITNGLLSYKICLVTASN